MTPPTDARLTRPTRFRASGAPSLRTARAAGALVLTTALISTPALVSSPALAGATSAGELPAGSHSAALALSDTVSIEAPGAGLGSSGSTGDGGAGLGGATADQPDGGASAPAELAASQEGAWFLGQSVDSVLGPGQWYSAHQGRTWYGAYRTFSDQYSYCTDAGLRTPHPRFFADADTGRSLTAARTAWALGTHRNSDSSATHAALSAMVRLDDAIPHRHAIPPGHPKDLGPDFAEAARAFTTISADAKRYAGPYTLDISIRDLTIRALENQDADMGAAADMGSAADAGASANAGASADTGASAEAGRRLAAVVSLTSAAGHEVPGHTVEVTVTGAQAPDERITTGEDPTSVDLIAASGETVTVEATVAGLPAHQVVHHRPTGLGSDRVQAVVTPGEPVTLTAEDSWKPTEESPRPTPPPPPPSPQPVPTATATYSPPPTTAPPTPAPPTRVPEPTPEPSTPPTTPAPSTEAPTTEAPPPPEPTRTPETTPPGTPEPSETPEPPETPEATETPQAVPSPEDTRPPEDETPSPDEEEPPAPPQGGQEPPAPAPLAPAPPAPAPPAPDTLPRTGVDATAAAGLALTLVAVGVGALTMARRR